MKRKRKQPVQRNPEARELLRNPLFRSKAMKSAELTQAQANWWNRRAKHRRKAEAETD